MENRDEILDALESISGDLDNDKHFGVACGSHYELTGSSAPIMALTVTRMKVNRLIKLVLAPPNADK